MSQYEKKIQRAEKAIESDRELYKKARKQHEQRVKNLSEIVKLSLKNLGEGCFGRLFFVFPNYQIFTGKKAQKKHYSDWALRGPIWRGFHKIPEVVRTGVSVDCFVKGIEGKGENCFMVKAAAEEDFQYLLTEIWNHWGDDKKNTMNKYIVEAPFFLKHTRRPDGWIKIYASQEALDAILESMTEALWPEFNTYGQHPYGQHKMSEKKYRKIKAHRRSVIESIQKRENLTD